MRKCEDCGLEGDYKFNLIVEGDSDDGKRKVLRCMRCWTKKRGPRKNWSIEQISDYLLEKNKDLYRRLK